jgi:hypothetical protein
MHTMIIDGDEIDAEALFGAFRSALWFPRYRAGSCGAWRVRLVQQPAVRGYWGTIYQVFGTVMLTGPSRDNAEVWMSMTPMEVESQEIGIAAARGHTVVLGLGMGWATANIALNPAVERVTVVERDRDIVALVDALGIFAQLPHAARCKIDIVVDDALAWRPDAPVDSLQADIWLKVTEPAKWDDVRRMCDNIRPASLYFWGQEMELWRLACRATGGVPDALTAEMLGAMVADSGLPLITDSHPDYAARITAGAPWWTPRAQDWWRAEAR